MIKKIGIDKEKYDWDLESLLGNEKIDDFFKKWKNYKNKILLLFQTFCDSESNFLEWKKQNLIFSKLTNKLINYISNHLNEDVINHNWISWSQKIDNELNDLSKQISSISNITLTNKEKILNYLKNPLLKDYVRGYQIFFKNAIHILSEKEEKILTSKDVIDSSIETIYSTLIDGTIKFESVKNGNNKIVKINSVADFSFLLKSKDGILRKNAWYSFNNSYFKNKELLSQLLYSNYKMLNINAKISKYNDYIDQCCNDDEINKDLVISLYKHAEKFKHLFVKFNKLKEIILKKLYKLKKVEPWDKSLEIIKNTKIYKIEEIQKIVLASFSCFGNEYISNVKKAFNEKWISWLPKKNKHSGAYSIGGVLGLDKYYISMNYDKTIQSLYTIAHELGHSMHSYYFVKEQPINASCEIFYAEIASITNELILSFYLLDKEKNELNKLAIIDEMLSNFFSTTLRQIVFSNFEYDFIDKLNKNESITFEDIKVLFFNNMNKYLDTKKDFFFNKKYECYQSTILRISHFYVGNFYVYKYAIGQIAAFICAHKIFNKDDNFINKYFNFLKSGSSLSPIDTIKLLEIDFTKIETFDICFKGINELLSIYESIANNLLKKV